jgi:putative phosphotransacetylase
MIEKIPIEVSARHCHLSERDLEKLFGEDYQLKKMKQLSQPSEFACSETVEIQFGSKKFEKVRVVGPIRGQTQVEISLTDAVGSGVVPPLRLSGDLKGSAVCVIKGPKGEVKLSEGVIVAKRHLHCSLKEAEKLGLKNGDTISIKAKTLRPVVFEDVAVRVDEGYSLDLHLDTDEGNAAGINKKGEGVIYSLLMN